MSNEKSEGDNSIETINQRIENEYDEIVFNQLSDVNLIDQYKDCKSVKKKIKILSSILEKQNIEDDIRNNIINEFLFNLIPPGTKAAVRGNNFNKIIKEKIKEFKLDTNKYEIKFEENCPKVNTSEIPDWYILEKSTNKLIIGMNQVDLWSGGAQMNRAFKYLVNNEINNENTKLLCVVCNKKKIKNENNKVFKIFKSGFDKDTLCYVKNLENIIKSFFEN